MWVGGGGGKQTLFFTQKTEYGHMRDLVNKSAKKKVTV